MNKQALDNLVKIHKLHTEPRDSAEVDGLIRSGTVRLKDAALETLSIESRFDLAYNAAHALSLAALRQLGYRSDNRYLVFQCLQHTLELAPAKWRVIDQAHRKRNLAEYEGIVDVDEASVESLLRIAEEIRLAVLDLTGHDE
ncbi:hypothetical protein RE428_42360 [Marinobacter nanhaiticus D15-8W]|uniref:HEPN domain-containing protein n=1 Tax=Marinobacter nanhaiticus D15-8W TaxID=626887 RepID=N6X4A9_9GAMM|nr:hypothetical protein [Marinobacter nanhaiticus]ENO15923.2 hypothetical protein J057_11241 [Marinobacter nanhaiticus D15-8W]BES73218.1 hypothetical protein RE428_42360 [Marinobacter nanhaiticus D15-8W]